MHLTRLAGAARLFFVEYTPQSGDKPGLKQSTAELGSFFFISGTPSGLFLGGVGNPILNPPPEGDNESFGIPTGGGTGTGTGTGGARPNAVSEPILNPPRKTGKSTPANA